MAIKLKTYKKDFEHSYSFGVFTTMELIKYRSELVMKILISSNSTPNEGVRKIKDICKRKNIEVEINDKLISKLSPKKNCYCIGVFKKYYEELESNRNHVVLVNPGDMGNLGTIIRTMKGFGINNLAIVRPGVDIFNPKVVRGSMGAVFGMNFQYFNDFTEYMNCYDNEIFTFMLKTNKTLHDVKSVSNKPFALVYGNESSGLENRFLNYGTSIKIPHSDNIDSLNLAVAVGVSVYEFTKKCFAQKYSEEIIAIAN